MKLHFQIIGEGPPVVVTSGMGQSSAVWDSLARTLAGRFKVLQWDYRGHGRSAASDDPEDYTARLAQDDLISMIGHAGGNSDNPAVLVGHSLGGYLSLRAALEVPSLIKRLVLIATGPGFRDEAARDKWNEFARQIPIERDVHPLARQMSVQSDSLVMDHLRSIEVPALVIVGSDDRRFIGAKNYMVTKMPQAAGIDIPGARHSVHTSHPILVNEAILRFLVEGLPLQEDGFHPPGTSLP